MKKLVVASLLLFTFIVPFVNAEEVDNSDNFTGSDKFEINVYIFRGEGCSFCENVLAFLKELKKCMESILI